MIQKGLSRLLAVFTLLFLLTACQSDGENVSMSPSPDEKDNEIRSGKIVLISNSKADTRWSAVNEGCQTAVAELGEVEYAWLAPETTDNGQVAQLINQAVTDGTGVILMTPTVGDDVTRALDAAHAAGVRMFMLDTAESANAVQLFYSDGYVAGATAGNELLTSLTKKGVASGSIGIIDSDPDDNGFADGVRSALTGQKFQMLPAQNGGGDATVARDMAEDYIRQDCVGIVAAGTGATYGVGLAIQNSGREDVTGVGWGYSEDVQRLINEGSLLCAVSGNYASMGYEAMRSAVRLTRGESPGERNVDPGLLIMRADAASSPVDATGRVVLVTADKTKTAWQDIDRGCQKAVAELGSVQYRWIGPDTTNDESFSADLAAALQEGTRMVLLATDEVPETWADVLSETKALGIGVIYIGATADAPSLQTYTLDLTVPGRMAGERLRAALEDAGQTSGKIGLIGGAAATTTSIAYAEGFLEVFEGTQFSIQMPQYGSVDVEQAKILATQNIQEGYVGLFGLGEMATEGIGSAIKEVQSKETPAATETAATSEEPGNLAPIGVGIDASEAVRTLIREDALLCVVTQNAVTAGYEAMINAARVLRNEVLGSDNAEITVSVLTKDNV